MAIMLVLLSLILIILPVLLIIFSKKHKPYYSIRNHSLPPTAWPRLPLIGSLFCLTPTISSLSTVLRRLHDAHGPIVSLWVGGKPAILITSRDIAHRVLVQMGTTFTHRPASLCRGLNRHGVNSATGSRWGLLRRNLCSHLAAAHVTAVIRSSTDRLVGKLESVAVAGDAAGGGAVVAPSETFRHAVFGLFAALCFGEGVDDDVIRHLRGLHAEIVAQILELDVFDLVPPLVQAMYYLPGRYRKLLSAKKRHRALVTALISALRRRMEEVAGDDGADPEPRCYADTLLRLGLGEGEMVSLCWEYMNASVHNTAAALEWIMARLVLHQDIQLELWTDIAAGRESCRDTASGGDGQRRRPLVEAVVLEALRLHPPAHYLLAHTADGDVLLEGYAITKGAVVNVSVASIGRDAALWSDATEFRPQRFMDGGEGAGVHCVPRGSSGGTPETMKMTPFGAGRRACPGAAVTMAVLQSFVQGLVTRFEWKPVAAGAAEEAAVDLTEKQGIVTEMRTSLVSRLVFRGRKDDAY
ncbi:hypothetical protein ACP4OV_011112 [Aristida adscensionis]